MKWRFVVITLIIPIMSAELGGCQIPLQPDADSPFYEIPEGSTLVLNRDITIRAGTVRTLYQGGREVYAPNQWEPFCKFEILTLKDEPQQVKADEFVIYRSGRGEDTLLVGLETLPRYARAGILFFDDDQPSPHIYGTYLFLRSPAQPDVYRLLCGHLQDSASVPRHLTINQIRAALGDTFTLQIAQLP
jgi:hypothetical protein